MTTTTPPLRAQVLALRRTQSARAVAQALNIPLGTVKAISFSDDESGQRAL